MLRALFKDTVLYSSSQILPRVFAFLLLPWISQYLGPEDYGILGSIAILYLIATPIVSLGLNISINKTYFETSKNLIWTSFLVILIFNGFLLGGVYALAPSISYFLLGKEASSLVMIALASVSLSGLIVPFSTYLKLEKKAFVIVSLAFFEVLTASLLTLYLVIGKGMGVEGPLLSQLIAQVILLVLYLAISRLPFKLFFGKEFRETLVIGLPYMFSFLGAFLIQSGARFALVKARGLEESGIFFIAQNCAKIMELFMMGMMAAWVPLIAEIAHNQEMRMKAIKKVTSTYTLVIGLPVCAAFLLAKPVLSILVPPELASGWSVVGILALAQGFFGFYVLLQPLFVFERKGVFQVLLEASAGMLGTLAAFFGSFSLGIMGAAIGQLFACVFLVLATLIFLKNIEIDTQALKKVVFMLLAIIPLSLMPPESILLQFLEGGVILGLLVAVNYRPIKSTLLAN